MRRQRLGPLDPIYKVKTVYGAVDVGNSPGATLLTCTINQAAGQPDPTSTSPILFTAVFSEPVTGFSTGDVALTGTATGTLIGAVSGSGDTYTVSVSGMDDSGTVIADIPSGVCTAISSGIANAHSTSTDNEVTWDGAPVMTTLTIVGSVQDHTALDNAYSVKMHPTNPNYVVVVSQNSGGSVTCVDISIPTAPIVAATITHANLASAIDLAVNGSYAYVVCQSNPNGRLTIIDISNPLSLSYVGSVAAASLGFANGVDYAGGYCFVTGGNQNRIVAVNVSIPSAPTITSSFQDNTNLATPYGVKVDGIYAYVASNANHRLTIINVSNPASMTLVGSVQDATVLNTATRVHKINSTYVLVGAFTHVGVVNVTTPASPAVTGSYNSGNQMADVSDWNGFPIATGSSNDDAYGFNFASPPALTLIDDTGTDSRLDGAWGICADSDTQYIYATARFADRLVVIEVS